MKICNKDAKMDWIEDEYGECLEVVAEFSEMAMLPGDGGLEERPIRRAIWIQIPLHEFWSLADKAQIPLKIVRTQEAK